MKLDKDKIIMTACNAFVSAAFGAIGTYVARTVITSTDKAVETASKKKNDKPKIGFDICS